MADVRIDTASATIPIALMAPGVRCLPPDAYGQRLPTCETAATRLKPKGWRANVPTARLNTLPIRNSSVRTAVMISDAMAPRVPGRVPERNRFSRDTAYRGELAGCKVDCGRF